MKDLGAGANKKGGDKLHLFFPKSYHELNLLMLWSFKDSIRGKEPGSVLDDCLY